MTPVPAHSGSVGAVIRLAQQPGVRLHVGETVTLTVIKRLAADKWAVGIGGRVYPAISDLALAPGAVLRARVGQSAGKLLLSVSESVPDAVSVALAKEGLPAGGPAEMMARALARAGVPLSAQIIEKALDLLRRAHVEPKAGSRAAAAMADKGIDLSSSGARALLPILGFGERGGSDPRRYRGRPLPQNRQQVAEQVAAIAAEPARAASPLVAFNHLKGKSQSWVVIPFLFTAASDRFAGAIKILYDPTEARPLAMTITTEGIAFHLALGSSQRRLSVFCREPGLQRAAQSRLGPFRAIFRKLSVEVDDIVSDGDAFDGFSPIGEAQALPSIDTVG